MLLAVRRINLSMDFAANLRSPSVKDHCTAAIFLCAEGANGAEHLPALLRRCQEIDVNGHLDRFEEALLGVGAMTMGNIVGAVGFDSENALHVAILQWIVKSTASANTKVAAHSIYGLGNIGFRHPMAIECLSDLVTSYRRTDEHEFVSLRAIALRILRRLDGEVAATFVEVPAFDEYSRALEYWMNTTPESSEDLALELRTELDWLKKTRDR